MSNFNAPTHMETIKKNKSKKQESGTELTPKRNRYSQEKQKKNENIKTGVL